MPASGLGRSAWPWPDRFCLGGVEAELRTRKKGFDARSALFLPHTLAASDRFTRDLAFDVVERANPVVSAFPITYAAKLDAATKLHGISSSMRL